MASQNFVTIVSGLPRSGTSMMMQMLDKGGLPALTDNVRKPDEDNPKGYYEFEPVKKTKDDPSWVPQAVGKVVKMVYRLLYDLPADHSYRVLFMRRRLEEVIKSQDVMLERSGKSGGDLSGEQLLDLYRKEIDRCLDWMRRQPNFEFIEVDYNAMLADPRPHVRRINEFLGGGLNEQTMAQVVDPSLYRQRA